MNRNPTPRKLTTMHLIITIGLLVAVIYYMVYIALKAAAEQQKINEVSAYDALHGCLDENNMILAAKPGCLTLTKFIIKTGDDAEIEIVRGEKR